jgi:DNA primase
LLDRGFALVCEGQLDLIACHLAGIQNVVAPQGTAFTPEHARILKRYVDEVVLCFDADTAGQNAAVRVQESLLTSGLAVRVMTLPPSHDPDSFIRAFGRPPSRNASIRPASSSIFTSITSPAPRMPPRTKANSPSCVPWPKWLAKTGDAVLIDKYAQKTAMKLAAHMQMPLSPDAVRAQFKKVRRQPAPGRTRTTEASPVPDRPSVQEFWLLKLLLSDESLLDWAAAHLAPWIGWPWRLPAGSSRRASTRTARTGTTSPPCWPSSRIPNAQRLISEAAPNNA